MIAASHGKFDQALLRQAFGQFPSGVTAFCGVVDGRPDGMAASSFTSVSLDPALVCVCVANTSATWPRLAQLPRLGLSVLADEHGGVARSLASKSADRFADVDWHATEGGAVLVARSTLHLECSVFNVLEAGDHKIVLLQIEALNLDQEAAPMVVHRSRFRQLTHVSPDSCSAGSGRH